MEVNFKLPVLCESTPGFLKSCPLPDHRVLKKALQTKVLKQPQFGIY